MREGHVVVGDVVEKVDVLFLQEKAGCDGVNRCVAPPFIEEAAIVIETLKEINISLRTEPIEVSNFKVRPLHRVRDAFMGND